MADESNTPPSQLLDKWLQVTSTGEVELLDGTEKSSSERGLSGVTMADQWRLTSSFSGGSTITSNLERIDTTGTGIVGTGMSESSGIFTFPDTGYYLVQAAARFFLNDTNPDPRVRMNIEVTVDNSTYNIFARSFSNIGVTSDNADTTCNTQCLVKVEDTSLTKCRFSTQTSNANTDTQANTDINETYFTFLRLGDL